MIQTKCIQKFRDNSGKIYGYRLIDLNGQTQDVRPEALKNAIAKGQIKVISQFVCVLLKDSLYTISNIPKSINICIARGIFGYLFLLPCF